MQNWFHEHPIIAYIVILCFTIYIFNAVFRVQRLPIIKEILVHLIMAIGAFVMLVLQIDKLPIIQCMSVAVAMMLMLRGRQLYDKWKGRSGGAEPGSDVETGKRLDVPRLAVNAFAAARHTRNDPK